MPTSPNRSRAGHAIVIGGSMAGLLAARVLADHFEQVTLLERDRFPDGPAARTGLPQGHHIHVLLNAGRRALERLMPNLIPDLRDAGADDYDGVADFRWISPAGLNPRFPSAIRMLGATRHFIDHGVRQQLGRLGRIDVRTEVKVTGLRVDRSAERVIGVNAAAATPIDPPKHSMPTLSSTPRDVDRALLNGSRQTATGGPESS